MSSPATARAFSDWDTGELPPPPVFHASHWRLLIGPGLLTAGANIGGGEWLLGPLVTAQYGGRILWLAMLAIMLQVFYNLSVMRYALFCGENIFVGFFRTPPGPRFWTVFYMVLDLAGTWPYLASNAAVPLAAVLLGRLPGNADSDLVRLLGYAIFLAAFVPLIFGGKIYNVLERVMVTKLVFILSYLGFIALFWVSWDVWREILSGLFRFGALPPQPFNWATLAAFTAVAGAGGLNNATLSSYVRDKGWGMGSQVGALPSAIGGRTIKLSHTGKVFELTSGNLRRWTGWLRHIRRDQVAIWGPACVIGMVLPSMISFEYLRGITNVDGNAVAAMSAEAIAARHGRIFWFLTLLCGFLIMAPTQVSQLDGIARRWTDVIWIGSRRFSHLDGNKVKRIYYSLLAAYGVWGLVALRVTPSPLVLAIATGVMVNFSLAFSALHVLWVNLRLLPPELRPGWTMRIGIVACAVLYITISVIALHQQWPKLVEWVGRAL
jgi:hypothetical protein